jgi:hypothetical protein
MKNLALFLIVAGALVALSAATSAAEPPLAAKVALHAECGSAEAEAACSRCEVATGEDLELPAGQRVLTWSCPRMAGGRYSIKLAVPFRLVPAQPAPALFSQMVTSFSGTIRGAAGQVRPVPLQESPVSLSWWGGSAALMERTAQIEVGDGAELDFELRVEDAAYYVPLQTQGPAFRDGKLIVQKAVLGRLLREPTTGPDRLRDPGAPRDFDPATLARIVPGKTTRTEVEALLGEPWRASEPDADEAEPGVWEYRGRDQAALYRVHIEFDGDGTARLVSKVPENTSETTVDIEKAPPRAAKQ